MRLTTIIFLAGIFAFNFYQCKQSTLPGSSEHLETITAAISDDALMNADVNHGNWTTYGLNYREDRHSELDQINKDNLEQLGLAWTLDLGTKRGIQTTPLIVDGILFATGPWSVVWAIDARTGQQLWRYDPKVPREKVTEFCCGVINRGLAMYEGDLFLGTLDARLISLNAEDGSVNWEINTKNDESRILSITGAPRIAKGRVIIGNGGAEFNARGYVSAFNAKTGDLAWRFFTVPGNPADGFEHSDLEDAANTWTGEWWTQGGGGTVWDAIVYDPEFNNIYIGVGNGSHWDRQIRSPQGGDNLYLSSIVALDADDGSYKWHYQTTPGDTWDYTATQHILLADLEIDGQERKVLMQAPKNGFFYVIDRSGGELISADAYTYMNWATGMGEDGRPIEAPGARYEDGLTHWITPSTLGGHNWQPMTYSKRTGYVYIPGAVEAEPYQHNPNPETTLAGALGAQVSLAGRLYVPPVFDTHPEAPQPGMAYGQLIAYDPVKQEKVWSVRQAFHSNGGLLSTTTGLLMQGDAQGIFSIRDDETGDILWEYDVRSGVIAPPVTYMVDGEQHITLFVGWGGRIGQFGNAVDRIHPGTVYTFKLGGEAEAPEKLPPLEKSYTTLTTDAAQVNIGEGFNIFVQYCIGCHVNPGMGGGAIPDLTMSSDGIYNAYNSIILDGQLSSEGMPAFGEYLTEEEVEDLKSYILYTAEAFRNQMNPLEYMTNLATMQYMADMNPPKRKNIE